MTTESTAPCERCGAELAADATECPECGHGYPRDRTVRLVILATSAVAVVASAVAASFLVALWAVDEGSRGLPTGLFAVWAPPGLIGAALLLYVRARLPRTATARRDP